MADKPIKALLVEDSPTDALLLQEALKEAYNAKFELTHARKLAEALGCLDQQQMDVALLDLGLPDSQGLETFIRLRDHSPNVPVVVLSGLDDESLAMKAVQSGAQDYLVKGNLPPGMLVRVLRYSIERKRAEEALRLSEERYRDLFENANDIIYTSDLEGNITSLNKAGEKILGYSLDEALKLNVAQLVAPEYLHSAQPTVGGNIEEEAHTVCELEVITKDGGRVTLEVSRRLMRKRGEVIGAQCIARDITERKSLEQQLRQSQKMEAIGRLAGGVAHDFNNLLTAIVGYSQLAMSRLAESDSLRREIEEVIKAGQRAASLTNQLLIFSRKQVIQPKVIELNDIVADLKKMLGRLIGEDIEVRTVLDASLNRIKADPGQIEQVILNLAVNARDAMPEGGTLTIETANVYLNEVYAHKHVDIPSGHYVMLAVSDTGVGMDKEIQSHIFEPFFTTKEQGKGTGLGLSTVYGIIKQSGGYIWVYSEPGRGSTFKIYLPRIEEAVQAPDPDLLRGDLLDGMETILVVEDDAGVRKLVCKALEMKGYTVFEAATSNEALDICRQYRGEISLTITDVVMPQMSGCELAERLRGLCPDMKILFMSGYTDNSTLLPGLMNGEMAFLQKPFAPESLARKVREVISK